MMCYNPHDMDRIRVIALLLCLFVAFETPAKAYTDPGTGALIFQMIAAGIVGAMFYFRRIRMFITGLWKREKNQ